MSAKGRPNSTGRFEELYKSSKAKKDTTTKIKEEVKNKKDFQKSYKILHQKLVDDVKGAFPEKLDTNTFEDLMITLGYMKGSRPVKEEVLVREAWAILFGEQEGFSVSEASVVTLLDAVHGLDFTGLKENEEENPKENQFKIGYLKDE